MRIHVASDTSNGDVYIQSNTSDSIPEQTLLKDRSLRDEWFDYPIERMAILDRHPSTDSTMRMSSSLPVAVGISEISETKILDINVLFGRNLNRPIKLILEPDSEGYIARTIDLPLYGYGDDPVEATQNLKYEIESLYEELMEDDNFSDEWLKYRELLRRIIGENNE